MRFGRRAGARVVSLAALLATDRPLITDVHLEGMVIRGPGIIVPWLCDFTGSELLGGEAAFWPLMQDRPVVIGAITVERSTFRDCVFTGVGLAAPEGERSAYEHLWQAAVDD